MADAKTWMDLWIAVVPSVISTGGLVGTAWWVTRKVELAKIEAQRELEREKAEAEARRKRADAQLDLYRELYKGTYKSRLESALQLAKMVGVIDDWCRNHPDWKRYSAFAEVEGFVSQNALLLGDEVREAVQRLPRPAYFGVGERGAFQDGVSHPPA